MRGMTRLRDKFAVITGSSRGIGRAVAERFALEGATVAINHIGDEEEAKATRASLDALSARGGFGLRKHRIVEADIGSTEAIKTMFDWLINEWGRLDILVNNAGWQAPTPGDKFDHATFESIVAVDLLGPAYCAEAAISHFLSRPGGGVIINTTSVHEIVPKPTYLAYSISKGGLGNLTRTLALEFADKGIRVNAVGPGAVLTSINDAWRNDPRAKQNVENHIPVGYAAEPSEIAPVYAFLASDDAKYITGQTIYACGGITLYADFQTNWAS